MNGGDMDDVGQVLQEHLEMVHALARRLTRSRPEAEDLVQETCLRALRAWHRGAPDDPRAWLATICLNTARSAWRRPVHTREVLDSDAGGDAVSPHDTAAAAIARTVRDEVHRALWQLPEAQREAITLMDLCGFTASQVGQMLDVPRGTVLARVHRGHKRLVNLLEREGVTTHDV